MSSKRAFDSCRIVGPPLLYSSPKNLWFNCAFSESLKTNRMTLYDARALLNYMGNGLFCSQINASWEVGGGGEVFYFHSVAVIKDSN